MRHEQAEALGNSSAFWAKIQYRWVTPAPECGIVGEPVYLAEPPQIIPSNNCDSSVVSREACSSNKRLATPETPVAEEEAEAKPAAEQTTNPTTEVKVDAAPSAEEAPAAKKVAPAKEAPAAEPTPAETPAAAEPTEALATEG